MGKVMFLKKGEVHTAPVDLPPVGTSLNDLTWEEIRAISDAGKAANYFSVGDTKSIVINGNVGNKTFSNLEIDVFIIGINHNADKEGSNRIHFCLGKVSEIDACLCGKYYNSQWQYSGEFNMSPQNNNSGGWSNCHMRKTILGSDSTPDSPTTNTLLAALPADLRTVMKHVTKYSDNTGNGSGNNASVVTPTVDYLWLLSEFEVFGSRTYSNSSEQNFQQQYDYYAAGNSKVKYKQNALTTACAWWLRSVLYDSSVGFCYVDDRGLATFNNALNCYGISPAFCV